jgi:hypothetical protein
MGLEIVSAFGTLGGEATASGTPCADTPGARGKAVISLTAGNDGVMVQGSLRVASGFDPEELAVVGGAGAAGKPDAAPVGVVVTAAKSDALGGPLCGAIGTPGNEYISIAGENTGADRHGSPFSPSAKFDDLPGISGWGAVSAGCGTRAVIPASEAAMARKSASPRGPAGGDDGTPPALAGGTTGNENDSNDEECGNTWASPQGPPRCPLDSSQEATFDCVEVLCAGGASAISY